MKMEVKEDRRDVHCFRAILSEQDLERVGGASPLAGLRRTMPRLEKKPRPRRVISGVAAGSEVDAGVRATTGTGVRAGSSEGGGGEVAEARVRSTEEVERRS